MSAGQPEVRAKAGRTTVRAPASSGELFAGIPIFSSLSKEALGDLAARASMVTVRAGEYLFHQGDPPDSMYVVSAGRLEVVMDEPNPVIARVLTRGSVLGELAILTGSPRSASVRAKRDSELIKVLRDDFIRLLEQSPGFGADLARALGRELQASRGLSLQADPLPATIAVIALAPGLPTRPIGEGLARSISNYGTASTVRSDTLAGSSDSDFAHLIDEKERGHDKVLLIADARDPEHWREFCLRQADRVLALLDSRTPPLPASHRANLRGCDLVWCESPAAPQLGRWLEALDPRAVFSVPPGENMDDRLEPIARRLTGHSTGIVLSGGGARGAAHIGVLAELLESGVTIDRVGGCSVGSLVGASLAFGMAPDEQAMRWRQAVVERNPVNDYTIPAVSLVRGRKLMESLRNLFGSVRIEQLPREFFCISADLYLGELYVHRRGPLVDAVYASMCIPGIFPPAVVDGRVLVDGGVLNNLPVETMATPGEGKVIAIDLTIQPGQGPAPGQQRRAARARRWATAMQAALTGGYEGVPGLRETMMRSLVLGSVDTSEVAQQHADVVIDPDTRSIGLLEFEALNRGMEVGRRAARAALEDEATRERLLAR